MLKQLSFALVISLLSCADHGGSSALIDPGSPNPSDPINPPDGGTFTPPTPPGGGGGPSGGGPTGGGSGKGGSAPVPEPTTMLLVGSGLAGAALYRRRKNRTLGIQED